MTSGSLYPASVFLPTRDSRDRSQDAMRDERFAVNRIAVLTKDQPVHVPALNGGFLPRIEATPIRQRPDHVEAALDGLTVSQALASLVTKTMPKPPRKPREIDTKSLSLDDKIVLRNRLNAEIDAAARVGAAAIAVVVSR